MNDVRCTTASGGRRVLPGAALETFRTSLRGPVIRPGQDGYDRARSVFNAMIDRRPAIIARCEEPAGVVAAVRFNYPGDEGEVRTRAAYEANYERLVALKDRYDPTNLFRLNQNITPRRD